MSAQESESPWLIDYLRMRAVNTTLSPAEARAVATLYDTAIAQRDAAVRELKVWERRALNRITLEAERDELAAKLSMAERGNERASEALNFILKRYCYPDGEPREDMPAWAHVIAQLMIGSDPLESPWFAELDKQERTPTPPQEATTDA